MAYSKAKLKSNGDRAPPCFKPFLIANISDKFLPTQTLLYISVRHIFISLTSFLEIPNSMRILYKASLLTESQAFLKSIKSWCTASLCSHFFSSIWQIQNIWSVSYTSTPTKCLHGMDRYYHTFLVLSSTDVSLKLLLTQTTVSHSYDLDIPDFFKIVS